MNFEDLLSMSLDESETLLEDLMVSENQLIKAPNYLKEEISTKCQKTFLCAKRFQLFTYSVKVCAAVAFALLFLFSISPTEFTYPFDAHYQKDANSQEILQDKEKPDSWISDMKESFLDKGNLNSHKSEETIRDIISDDTGGFALDDIAFEEEYSSKDFESVIDTSEHRKEVPSRIQLFIQKIQDWLQQLKRTKNNRNNQY